MFISKAISMFSAKHTVFTEQEDRIYESQLHTYQFALVH